jgi:hypothetical protein
LTQGLIKYATSDKSSNDEVLDKGKTWKLSMSLLGAGSFRCGRRPCIAKTFAGIETDGLDRKGKALQIDYTALTAVKPVVLLLYLKDLLYCEALYGPKI